MARRGITENPGQPWSILRRRQNPRPPPRGRQEGLLDRAGEVLLTLGERVNKRRQPVEVRPERVDVSPIKTPLPARHGRVGKRAIFPFSYNDG